MHRREGFDRFDFNDDAVFDDQVRSKSYFNLDAFIDNGDRLLPDDAQSPLFELIRQDYFVDRLQQSWSQAGVNTVGRVHDLLGYFVFGHVKSKTNSRQAAKPQGKPQTRPISFSIVRDPA